MVKIEIPCRQCGCQELTGTLVKSGAPAKISICKCSDGSGYYEVQVTADYGENEIEEPLCLKFKSIEEVESLINSSFDTYCSIHQC